MLLKDWLKCLAGKHHGRRSRRLICTTPGQNYSLASIERLETRQLLSATDPLPLSSLDGINWVQLNGIETGDQSELTISIADEVNRRVQIAGLKAAIANSENAVSLVQTAEGALEVIESLLIEIRGLAIDSANTGVNDEDDLAANQMKIDHALDAIDRIANNTQFGTKKLLDGSASVKATSTDNAVSTLKATPETTVGMYFVTVTTPAERAHVSSSAAQGSNTLGADETLTVNDVEITLTAGLTHNQVVDRINEFTTQTGVKAEIDTANGGVTRLYTEDFGIDAQITAISNVAASESSSGIGHRVLTDHGEDIVGTVGGTSFNGSGNLLTPDFGPAKGLAIQISASDDAVTTGTAVASMVFVTDNTLQFQIGPNPNQTASLSIDRVNPVALGFGVGGNQFYNLNEVDVTSAGRSQDSLGVIDAAIDDIVNLRARLVAFRTYTLEATANSLRATLEVLVNIESVMRDTHYPRAFVQVTLAGAGDINGGGFYDLIMMPSFRYRGASYGRESYIVSGGNFIDITVNGAHILTLNPLEVLNLSRHSNTLTVFRDLDDMVNIGTGWTQQPGDIADAITFEVVTREGDALKVQETGPAGDLDGDGDFDANDSFLIHLVELSGTGTQIAQSKGSGPLNATQIQSAAANLNVAGDVDGDGDFDANDSFLIHLVKLAGTDTQIDRSKGSSSLSAAEIRANIDALSGADATQTVADTSELLRPLQAAVPTSGNSLGETNQPANMFPVVKLSARELIEIVSSATDVVPTGTMAVSGLHSIPESVWDDFRHWIDAI